MRLTASELAFGWTKFTVSCEPTSKLCQPRERFWLFCWMVVILPDWMICPAPAVTWPPLGAAKAALAQPSERPMAATARAWPFTRERRRAPCPLVVLRESSEVTIHRASERFQRRR